MLAKVLNFINSRTASEEAIIKYSSYFTILNFSKKDLIMEFEDILSYILFLPFLLDVLIKYIKGEKEYLKKSFSYFFFLLGVSLTLKLIFKVPRANISYFDPYAFPSTHAMLATLPVFIFINDKKRLIFYLILMISIDLFRVFGGYHTYDQVIAGNLIGFLSLYLLEHLRNKTKDKGIDRKSIHIGLAVLIGYISYINQFYGILLLIFLILLGILLYILKSFIGIIRDFLEWYSKDKSGKEAFTLVIGIFIPSIIGYLLNIPFYYIAFYIAWLDGLATIFSIYFKPNEIEKGIYHISGGIIGGIIAYLATSTNPIIIPILILIKLVLKIDDNLILPISAFLINTLFSF